MSFISYENYQFSPISELSIDNSIEKLTIQLSQLKLSENCENNKGIDDLINKLDGLHISDNNQVNEDIDSLIKQMGAMNLTEEIKFIILHIINQCKLQYTTIKHYPTWQEAF